MSAVTHVTNLDRDCAVQSAADDPLVVVKGRTGASDHEWNESLRRRGVFAIGVAERSHQSALLDPDAIHIAYGREDKGDHDPDPAAECCRGTDDHENPCRVGGMSHPSIRARSHDALIRSNA